MKQKFSIFRCIIASIEAELKLLHQLKQNLIIALISLFFASNEATFLKVRNQNKIVKLFKTLSYSLSLINILGSISRKEIISKAQIYQKSSRIL